MAKNLLDFNRHRDIEIGGKHMKEEYETKLEKETNVLQRDFPEYTAVKTNLLQEILQKTALEKTDFYLTVTTVLTVMEGNDLPQVLSTAIDDGIPAASLQEVFHQTAPYVGFCKAEKGLAQFGQICREKGLALPLAANSTTTQKNRLEAGIAVQQSIFGKENITSMRQNAPADEKKLQDFLSAYCFGDTYTRKGLEVKERELITFVCIAALGGCENQLRAHTSANLSVGNTRLKLLEALQVMLPYIGFPRTLNAVAVVDAIAKKQ